MDFITNNAQANIIYQEDPNKLDLSRIFDFILHHKNYQQPRLQKLASYYSGQNVSVLQPDSRRLDDGSDARLVHPFAQEIADFQASFSVGNPITIDVDDEDHDTLDEVNKQNDVDTLYSDIFLDAGKFGRGFALAYREEGYDYERLVRLDPVNTFMIYNQDVDYKPIMAVRYVPVQVVTTNGTMTQVNMEYNVETWSATEHINYQPTNLSVPSLVPVNVEELFALPVVEFWNNNLRIGDYENVISLIDAYDAAQSDTANYMTDLNDAMLVIKGDIDSLTDGMELALDPTSPTYDKELAAQIEQKKQILLDLKQARLLLLKSGNNAVNGQTNVDAQYIHKEYDTAGVEAYKNRLYRNIHTLSRTPDVSDESFAGNASGVAMRYKQLGVIQQAKTKRRMFEKGLYALYTIVQTLEQQVSGAWKIDVNDIRFAFHDNLPSDDVETILQIVQAGATLPQQYLYKFLPEVSDPDEIVKMMDEQRNSQDTETTRLAMRDAAVENDDEQTRNVSVQQGTNQGGQAPFNQADSNN